MRPACLPTAIDQFSRGSKCGISGWGASNLTQRKWFHLFTKNQHFVRKKFKELDLEIEIFVFTILSLCQYCGDNFFFTKILFLDMSEYPKCLQTAAVTLIENATCVRAHQEEGYDPEVMFCAGVSS